MSRTEFLLLALLWIPVLSVSVGLLLSELPNGKM